MLEVSWNLSAAIEIQDNQWETALLNLLLSPSTPHNASSSSSSSINDTERLKMPTHLHYCALLGAAPLLILQSGLQVVLGFSSIITLTFRRIIADKGLRGIFRRLGSRHGYFAYLMQQTLKSWLQIISLLYAHHCIKTALNWLPKLNLRFVANNPNKYG